jgi:hypothetical protein
MKNLGQLAPNVLIARLILAELLARRGEGPLVRRRRPAQGGVRVTSKPGR